MRHKYSADVVSIAELPLLTKIRHNSTIMEVVVYILRIKLKVKT